MAVTLQLPLLSTRLSSARSTSRPSALVPTREPSASRLKVIGLPWLLNLPSRLCWMAPRSNLRLSGARASEPWLTVKLMLPTTAPSP
ncbi:hypothetical protein D3C84_710420 [compost metagenome]